MKRLFTYSIFLFLSACSAKTEQPAAAGAEEEATNIVTLTPDQIKTAGIRTGKPAQQNMEAAIRVNGVVEAPPENKVTISFPYGGYIAKAELLPGMQVRKGQVLAVLQDPQFVQLQQDYLMARSKLLFLEKEYERQRALNASKTTSDKVFEQTASEYRAERIMVQALKEKLLLLGINTNTLSEGTISRTVNLYAPISGYVSVVNVNRGKYVSPTDVLFELVDPADLHLSLTVFEKDLAQIHPGQKVKAWLNGDSAQVYYGSVHYVAKTLDDSRSALVHCDFTGAIPKLVPGMFLNADVLIDGRMATVVPEDAVVRFGAGEYIFTKRSNNSFEMVPVQTGVRENGMVALQSQNPALLQQEIIVKNAYAALMKLHNKSEEE
ncbi:membrane fusion protein, cobalt-zinc-cadmium efflux system [Cnuella takakiae]|uniref:Membrane fusion protein, cobalt-zinc-cadmium efflux system n=1 Tax=Cnuella takakiae TaxID=1302690 RepID=A0A1M5ACQ7_9BACT|nr:efflux RND transporter periplasmic adaptor subunit [Cnuella takakiae]OLY94749.1 efflux transporter periplasmic adaptor subunit [Cnuella takakiae]SHF28053.1 membrane fusion protein, cobalt-zinc-cadmium efflux system [Cnuella takakiae]